MGIKDEFLFDFSLNMPRILVSGNTGILDHVKKIVLISGENIVVDCGAQFLSLTGEELVVDQLEEQRMQITGRICKIEFYQRDQT